MRWLKVCVLVLSLVGVFFIDAASAQDEKAAEVGKPKIEMKPFNLALLSRGRVEGKLTLYLVLLIEKEGAHEKVRQRMPQIRSDFNSALTVLAKQRFSVTRPVDPDVVKAYLTPYLDYRLGAGVVSVFVKQALIEPA